jgi:hypothetical protein
MSKMPLNDDDYDAADDLSRSIEECYRAIRERMARGGPPWVPPTFDEPRPPKPKQPREAP